jgi:hypothetical protein
VYDLRLEDLADEKCRYAALSHESGAIRQRKAIDCEISFIKLAAVLGHQANFRTFRKKTVLSFIESV